MRGSQAPVALFAYARVNHLRKAVNSLLTNAECEDTSLYVFCDGPKSWKDKTQTDAVCEYVEKIVGFASVKRIYRDHNLGLAQSIISGVTEILSMHDSVIVMEDDLVVSPYFLKFMNEGLRQYRDNEQVASIHGYCFPVSETLPETFFLRGADCWAWASWSRAWKRFEPDGEKLLAELKQKKLLNRFDFDGAYPNVKMLKDQIAGKNESWAIRWHAACFIAEMLTLYPGKSLVKNIGNDDSGTHSTWTDYFQTELTMLPVQVKAIDVRENESVRKAVSRYLGRYTSLYAKAGRLIRRARKWTRLN
jgi:hypothetical protein